MRAPARQASRRQPDVRLPTERCGSALRHHVRPGVPRPALRARGRRTRVPGRRARRRPACPRAARPGLAVLARPHGPRAHRELAERVHGRDVGADDRAATSSTRARSSRSSRAGSAGTASRSPAPRPPRAPAGGCASSRCAARRASGSTGSRSASNTQPYTPFQLPARGLQGRPAEHARRARRQPPPVRHPRGLVELGRDHAGGLARPARPGRPARRRRHAGPDVRRRGRATAAGTRSSTAGWRTAARARSSRRCA